MATPRDLDPKFRDADIPENSRDTETQPEPTRAETSQEILKRLSDPEIPNDPEEGFIVMRSPFIASDGTVGEKVHGPMPVSEWAEYSRKNGL